MKRASRAIQRLSRSAHFRLVHFSSGALRKLRLLREGVWQQTLYSTCQVLACFGQPKATDISWYVVSLLRYERTAWVRQLSEDIPGLQVWNAINGYDPEVTMAAFARSGLQFRGWLDEWRGLNFNRYGKLACFLSRYFLLLHQVQACLPVMVFLEDDIRVTSNFVQFAKNCTLIFRLYPSLNMIRLGPLGEGYITSLAGAKRIVKAIQEMGIVDHSDMQLRKYCGREISLHKLESFVHLVPANCGDILQTPAFSEQDIASLLGGQYPGQESTLRSGET